MKRHRGFTIIELTLTLSIASLIFLMVFIALPGVLRASHDSERRDDMLTFIRVLKDFQANNNRGALPSGDGEVTGSAARNNAGAAWNTWTGFYRDFIPSSWVDPDGSPYDLNVVECLNNGTNGVGISCNNATVQGLANASLNHTLVVVLGAGCDGESAKSVANPRKLAALMRMESGGVYCVEN